MSVKILGGLTAHPLKTLHFKSEEILAMLSYQSYPVRNSAVRIRIPSALSPTHSQITFCTRSAIPKQTVKWMDSEINGLEA